MRLWFALRNSLIHGKYIVWSRAGTRYEYIWEHPRLAIVASILSSLDSFSFLIRKKCLTPSHLKLTDLTPSRIISPRLISPHLILTHLTSSHLIVITRFPWSRLTSCHLTLSYFTISHVMTSNPTLPHLILKLALKSIIASTKKREILCIMGITRIPPSSQSIATTKWNESSPGHCMPLHHVIVSYRIHQSFRVLKQHRWDPCPLHLSSAQSSRRCEENALWLLLCFPWLLPGCLDLGSHSSQRCDAADRLQTSDA